MKCTWCIQSNLNAIESGKIVTACEVWDQPHITFKLVPFSGRVPRINAPEPFVLIGSTTLNANALKSRKYRRGVFFNHNFTPAKYAANYGADYLNSDYHILQVKDIPDDLYPPDTMIFLRSNDDSKQISGGFGPFKKLLEYKKIVEKVWVEGDLIGPDSELFLSSHKEIGREFRFIVVDSKIITASQYQPHINRAVPDYVWNFARQMAKTWLPHPVCALDICEYQGLKVVECNCLNGCGFYAADYNQIIRAVTNYQIEKFGA